MKLAFILFLFCGYAGAGELSAEMVVVPVQKGFETQNFSLMDVEGAERSLSDFRGKVVLLNFWATWCDPCREEMPALERLWDELGGQGFVIVAVAAEKGNMHKVTDFCRMHGVTFPVLIDSAGEVKDAYRVTMLPTSFVIDRDGNIAGKIIGPRKWDGEDSKKFFRTILNR